VKVPLPTAVVVESHAEGDFYRLVRLARDREEATARLLAAHQVPGQFVKLAAGGDETYFALADAPRPGAGWVELLVKPGGSVADALVAARAGDVVHMSDPIGEGYRVDLLAEGRDLVLVAAGSGIAPIRALLLVALDRRAADPASLGRIFLCYGQARAVDFAFRAELSALADSGAADVVLCASAEGAPWSGWRGRVQAAVAADATHWRPDATIVAVCGMPALEADIRTLAVAHGLPSDRVLTNV
jgi:NAD(P)H-flavin reductase